MSALPPRAARAKRPGHKWTDAERKALSKALTGKHRTAAQKAAESKRMKGKKRPHKGHKASAKEKAALARGRALAKLHHHPLSAKQKAALKRGRDAAKAQHRQLSARQKAALARGRASAKARDKAHKLSAKQAAALDRARHRKHTAAQKAAESARLKGKHHTPPRGLRLHHRIERGHLERPGQHHDPRAGRLVAPAARTRRIYPSKFGTGHHRDKSRFIRGRAARAVHAPYTRGRHHIKNWGARGR